MSLEVPHGAVRWGQSEIMEMLSEKLRMMSIMSEAPPVPPGCQERRSGAQKKIRREIAAPRHILDRIGNQLRRRRLAIS